MLTCLFCWTTILFAQPRAYQVGGLAGYTLPNNDDYGYIASYNYGVAFDAIWDFGTDSQWKSLRPDTQFGVRASFLFCDNPIAGHRLAIEGTMRNTILGRFNDRHKLQWLLNFGLSYFTNPYERTQNEKNIFIGSYLNCMIDVGLAYRFGLSNGDAISLAFMLAHSSNGYLKKPNQGLNLLQLELGYQFSNSPEGTQTPFDNKNDSEQQINESHFFLSLSPAIVKARYPFDADPYYFAYTFQTGYLYALSVKRMVGASLDLMYNFSHSDIARSKGVDVPFPLYLGACADYETYWGPLSIRLAMGCYLHKSELESIPVYERVGAYYHFGNSLRQYVGVSLKAHYAHVDYIEWTYGIEL